MKILIISNSEWDDSNSFGNTFNDIFSELDDVEIANIYCREGKPNTETCSKFLKISDKDLLKSILDKKYDPAKNVCFDFDNNNTNASDKKSLMDFIRKKRWSIFFVLREILWSASDYKKANFYKFVEDFAPDMIFLPTYSFSYINKMALFIKDKYNLPMVSYMSDDEYSLRRFSLSPLFWMLRLYQSKWSIKGLKQSDVVYVISETQKKECERDLKINCKVLTKCVDFVEPPKFETNYNAPLQLIYTGNIGNNRYKTLAKIASQLKQINTDSVRAKLSIYTGTPLTNKMKKMLNVSGASEIKGTVSSKEVRKLQETADILVHVEAFDLKNRLAVHQSFSTKIVDYFHCGKCILAVGPSDVASIDYFKNNDAALVATSTEELHDVLNRVLNDKSVLEEYGKKAWQCGKRSHQRKDIQTMLKDDFNRVVSK